MWPVGVEHFFMVDQAPNGRVGSSHYHCWYPLIRIHKCPAALRIKRKAMFVAKNVVTSKVTNCRIGKKITLRDFINLQLDSRGRGVHSSAVARPWRFDKAK